MTGMVVAPHALAAEAGADVLREGGNAAEATVAIAAALAVVYPHMTGLGGDAFWLLAAPDDPVLAVDGAGRTPAGLTRERYAGLEAIPHRGPLAANTVAGAVSAWQGALEIGHGRWGGRLPLARLLEAAIHHAEAGFATSASQSRTTDAKLAELAEQPGFAEVYLNGGRAPAADARFAQPALGATLRRLAEAGPDDFYRGELAESIAADLAGIGSPVTRADLAVHHVQIAEPLALRLGGLLPPGTMFTTGPPTQGLATLMLLGQYAYRDGTVALDQEVDYVHFLVEATKEAFALRDELIRDPEDMGDIDLEPLLAPHALNRQAGVIDMDRAVPWFGGSAADTTWFGAIDAEGRAASAIQSLYHEFGSGVVLPGTGLCWQNRGASFVLAPGHTRSLRGGRKPFHTLCPSLLRLSDGRTLVCGTMGGEGQPQTQAAVLTRHLTRGYDLEAAIDAPRWLLGRTWGANSDTLKLESRFDAGLVEALRERGHPVEVFGDYEEMMGHAGAIARGPDGEISGAADPRGDGAALTG
ncbi:MAG TPA: gamma-glutamyltransferase [Gammaproteobacteria bacterium]|nr:gamma-glutamyltransferase [Gammaproteobacteria bacterium]